MELAQPTTRRHALVVAMGGIAFTTMNSNVGSVGKDKNAYKYIHINKYKQTNVERDREGGGQRERERERKMCVRACVLAVCENM